MNETQQKKIFTHVGLGKTGTTFLQYRVFPKFEGLYYIQRTRYRKVAQIINNTNYSKYLVSNEFDQQLEHEVKKFSASFPDATPIIVFRRHDSYIASQYRRFVKNGFRGTFTDFFDLENDNGYFKKHDLNYFRQIKILEEHYKNPPIVLFYDDFRNDAQKFVQDLAKRMDVTIDLEKVNFNRKHTSYREKQLKAMMRAGKHINLLKRRISNNFIVHLFWRLYLNGLRYSILYGAKLFSEKHFGSEPLISPDELEKVKNYYLPDWEKCKEYAQSVTSL